jgi:hypothetical protein
MARKTGQIIRRGPSAWLVRIYAGRDPETRKRKYIGKSIHGGLPCRSTESMACGTALSVRMQMRYAPRPFRRRCSAI